MGYNIHITRKDAWADPNGPHITLEEWHQYLKSDPEMHQDNHAEATTSEEQTPRLEAEGLAVWLAYSLNGIDNNLAWFLHSRGNITIKNPDQEILDKAIAIAKALSAKVQGDEGEYYPSR